MLGCGEERRACSVDPSSSTHIRYLPKDNSGDLDSKVEVIYSEALPLTQKFPDRCYATTWNGTIRQRKLRASKGLDFIMENEEQSLGYPPQVDAWPHYVCTDRQYIRLAHWTGVVHRGRYKFIPTLHS